MNSFKLSVITGVLLLSVASLVFAETSSGHEESTKSLNKKFKSKRPYHEPVDLKKSNAEAEKLENADSASGDDKSVESKKAYYEKRLKANKTSRRHQ